MRSNIPPRPILSLSHKLLLLVILILLTLAGSFVAFQYHREKSYKAELLNTRLQDLNADIFLSIQSLNDSTSILHQLRMKAMKEVRVTIITTSGRVLFDSSRPADSQPIENHLRRPEVQEALQHGSGYSVRRISHTTGIPYFYSATLFHDILVRSALPYDLHLLELLKADLHYLRYTLIVTLVLILLFHRYTRRLGTSIRRLREFALLAHNERPIDSSYRFPHNELGEVSRHIVAIYQRLHHTKEALYIEREKLITHLQISREGLGVFGPDKREILVNNLFTQYTDLLSDTHLESSEEVFQLPEMQPITQFIDHSSLQSPHLHERRCSIVVRKSGYTFLVECILFQDRSFEISLNDTTEQEEQSRLKRQLTQNISHELKTPVSSIQGYLETLLHTPGIPADKSRLFLERSYAQSTRLSSLLRDISMLARIDDAGSLIEMESVDVSHLVSTIFSEVSLQAESRSITLTNLLPPTMRIQGNHSLLYSIFRNLTDNAITYGGTGITVGVQCFREDDSHYWFSFSDNGIGVAPEHLNRLFERFYRIDKGRSRKLGGTGLGLAIVKNAVLLHGGTISAKERPQGGLEFVFTLSKSLQSPPADGPDINHNAYFCR